MKSETSFDNICDALVRHRKKKREKEAPTLPLPAERKPGSSQVLALRGIQPFQMREQQRACAGTPHLRSLTGSI